MRVIGSREAEVRTLSQHTSDLHHSVMFRAVGGLVIMPCTLWDSSAMAVLRFSVRVWSLQIRAKIDPLTGGVANQRESISDDIGSVTPEVLPLNNSFGCPKQNGLRYQPFEVGSVNYHLVPFPQPDHIVGEVFLRPSADDVR